ncbi:hypothetical protein ES703_47056 [subsurface metagenome]
MDVFLPQRHTRAHVHTALNLAEDIHGVDKGSRVNDTRHFKHPHLAAFGVDFDLGHLHPVASGSEELALTLLLIHTLVRQIMLRLVSGRLTRLNQVGVGLGSGLFHGGLQGFYGFDQGMPRHKGLTGTRRKPRIRRQHRITGLQSDFLPGYLGQVDGNLRQHGVIALPGVRHRGVNSQAVVGVELHGNIGFVHRLADAEA